jgi:hypothetical protein
MQALPTAPPPPVDDMAFDDCLVIWTMERRANLVQGRHASSGIPTERSGRAEESNQRSAGVGCILFSC